MHTPLEPFVSRRRGAQRAGDDPHRLAEPVLRAHGNRAAAGLAGEQSAGARPPYLGGGFGAKLYIKLEALVAALALLGARPVKIALTMEEQFFTITKHATTFRIKSGVTNDGKITARELRGRGGTAAPMPISARASRRKSGFTAAGPYDIEQCRDRFLRASTPTCRRPARSAASAFRRLVLGLRKPHRPDRARARHRPGRVPPQERPARRPPAGHRHDRCATPRSSRCSSASPSGWTGTGRSTAASGALRRGRGIAVGIKASSRRPRRSRSSTSMPTAAAGSIVSTVDMGQGSDTAMAQIAAEVLGIAAETVSVVHPDTDVTPYDMATLGSRSTFHMGHAVRLAARRRASARSPRLRAELGMPPGSNLPIAELFRRKYGMQAGNVVGIGSFIPNYVAPDHDTGQSPHGDAVLDASAAPAPRSRSTPRPAHCASDASSTSPMSARRSIPRSSRRSSPARRSCSSASPMSEKMVFRDGQLTNALARRLQDPELPRPPARVRQRDGRSGAAGRALRRQGRRRSATLRRLAGDRATRSRTRSACA